MRARERTQSLRDAILAETRPASHAASRLCGEAFPLNWWGELSERAAEAQPPPLRSGSHGVLAPPVAPQRRGDLGDFGDLGDSRGRQS